MGIRLPAGTDGKQFGTCRTIVRCSEGYAEEVAAIIGKAPRAVKTVSFTGKEFYGPAN